MPSPCNLRRLRRVAVALLCAASLVGCAYDASHAYRSPCDSPVASAYTSYCNPYRQSGGIDG